MGMSEQVFLRIFQVCLVGCAGLVLYFIWAGGPPAPVYAQVAASIFVIGLGSFLSWFVLVLYGLQRVGAQPYGRSHASSPDR